jgi:hypothetical protein
MQKKKASQRVKPKPRQPLTFQASSAKEYSGLKNTLEGLSNRMKMGLSTCKDGLYESRISTCLYEGPAEEITSEIKLRRVVGCEKNKEIKSTPFICSSYVEKARIRYEADRVDSPLTKSGIDYRYPPKSPNTRALLNGVENLKDCEVAGSSTSDENRGFALEFPAKYMSGENLRQKEGQSKDGFFDFELDSPPRSKFSNYSPEVKLSKRKRLTPAADENHRSTSKSRMEPVFKLTIKETSCRNSNSVQKRRSRSYTERNEEKCADPIRKVQVCSDAKKSPTAKQITNTRKLGTASNNRSFRPHFKTLKDVLLTSITRK